MTQELIDALVGMVDYVTSHRCRRAGNHYTQQPVCNALRALCKATGNSAFGYDYLDVIDKIKEAKAQAIK